MYGYREYSCEKPSAWPVCKKEILPPEPESLAGYLAGDCS